MPFVEVLSQVSWVHVVERPIFLAARHLAGEEASLVAGEDEPGFAVALGLGGLASTGGTPCLRARRPVPFNVHPGPEPRTGREHIKSTQVTHVQRRDIWGHVRPVANSFLSPRL